MLNRIAVMGAGSLGTILGAYLARDGLDVTLVDPWQEHVDALNHTGATVTGGAEMTVPVRACTPDQMEGTFDLFLYLAKQTYNDTAIPQMVSHCHGDSIICTGQNGIPELAVAEQWPSTQVCGAPVGWPATLLGPGVSKLTCTPGTPLFSFTLGTLDGSVPDWLLEAKSLLEHTCPVHLPTQPLANRWSKVLVNATFSGMSAVMNCDFGTTVATDRAAGCVARIGREVVQVCHANHIRLPEIFGIDYDALFDFHTPAHEKWVINAIKGESSGSRGKASMLQDLEKGKKCEVRAINGVVCEAGRKVGIPTPYCDAVVRILTEVEEGKRPLQNNLDAMPDIPLE